MFSLPYALSQGVYGVWGSVLDVILKIIHSFIHVFIHSFVYSFIHSFIHSFFVVARNYRFWMLSLPYALSLGVYGVWGSVLDVILKQRGVDQDTAGWVGFWSAIAGGFAGLMVGL